MLRANGSGNLIRCIAPSRLSPFTRRRPWSFFAALNVLSLASMENRAATPSGLISSSDWPSSEINISLRLTNAGHMVHLDNPGGLADEVLRFLYPGGTS